MIKKISILRSIILAFALSSAQSHALDQYWAKWLSAIIGTTGIITTFLKKDVYALYLAAKATQDPVCKEYYKEVYKDKKITLSDALNGHRRLRHIKSFEQLKTLAGVHLAGIKIKNKCSECAEKIKQSSIGTSLGLAYTGYAQSFKNIYNNLLSTSDRSPERHAASRIVNGFTLCGEHRLQHVYGVNPASKDQSFFPDIPNETLKLTQDVAHSIADTTKQTFNATTQCLGAACTWYAQAFKMKYAAAAQEAECTKKRMVEAFKKQQEFAQKTSNAITQLFPFSRLNQPLRPDAVAAPKAPLNAALKMAKPLQSPLMHPIPAHLEARARHLSLKQRNQLGIRHLNNQEVAAQPMLPIHPSAEGLPQTDTRPQPKATMHKKLVAREMLYSGIQTKHHSERFKKTW